MEFIKGQIGDVAVVDPLQDSSSEIPIGGWISAQKGQKKAKKGTRELTIKEALELAVKKLESGFILLLSDAHSEFECKSSDALYKRLKKLPVHAFGLGNENPEVLHRIAKISKGTYSSVTGTTGDLNSQITEAIALCLGGLQSVVAVGTRVDIKVEIPEPSILLKELKIEIQSGGHGISSSSSSSIPVGILYSGEVKDFIVHVSFTSKDANFSENERNRRANLTAQVYSSREQQAGDKCTLPLLVTRTSNRSACWEAYNQLKDSSLFHCRLVLRQLIRFDVLAKLDSFFAKDCRDPKKQQQRNNLLGEALQKKWNELMNEEGGRRFEIAQKMDLDLGAIRNGMDAMVRCLNPKEGGSSAGLRSIYSWASSYRMQRVATTGLRPQATTTEFLTADMKDAMDKAMEKARKKQLAKVSRTKSEIAKVLFGRVEKLLDWSERCPATTKAASSSSGGADVESRKHVDDFIRSIIYEAVVAAIKDWKWATSGEPPRSTTPSAPPEEGDGDTKSKHAIRLLDKIDELLNLSKMCLTTKASSSVGADNESQKRVHDLIQRLIYEVALAAMDEWWRTTAGKRSHSTLAALPRAPPVDGGTKAKCAIVLLEKISKLLDWSKVFPAKEASSSSGDETQKLKDRLIKSLIYEAAVLTINAWRATPGGNPPPERSPPVKDFVTMFDYIKNQLDFLEKNRPSKKPSSSRGADESHSKSLRLIQGSIYQAAVEAIPGYRAWRATSGQQVRA